MRKAIIGAALLLGAVTAVQAQGRGGRGAGPDWAKPQGTMCIDTDNIVKVEVLKGAAAAAAYGADAADGIVIIYTKPGPGLRNCAAPSNGGDDALGKVLLSPDLVMSHQQAIALTELQRQAIQSNMLDTQKKLLDQQFKLQGEVEKLQQLLKSKKTDAEIFEELFLATLMRLPTAGGVRGVGVRRQALLIDAPARRRRRSGSRRQAASRPEDRRCRLRAAPFTPRRASGA